jgi:PAS domain-containing protein
MATPGGGLAVGGDVEQALTGIPVPSYVLDTQGVVRWMNPAAERLLGNVRGRHFTSVVGAEDRARARELFARKVLGTTAATEASGVFVRETEPASRSRSVPCR